MTEEMRLRASLYNAACEYSATVECSDWDIVNAAASELERAAIEFAAGVGAETVRPEPSHSPNVVFSDPAP